MSVDTIALAIQYSSKIRRMGIANRLTDLARAKAASQEEDDEEEEVEEDEVQSLDGDDIEMEELSDFENVADDMDDEIINKENKERYDKLPCQLLNRV